MIDHCSQRTTPVTTNVSDTTVRYNCNCHHDSSSFPSAQSVAARGDAGNRNPAVVDERRRRRRVQAMPISSESSTVAPSMSRGAAVGVAASMWHGSRPVDDGELAADAEVRWLLRHAAAAPTTPEETDSPAIGGLQIGGSGDAPLTACVAPDVDQLPPYFTSAAVPASAVWCRLRPPSRDTRRRPCLNFDKMQV